MYDHRMAPLHRPTPGHPRVERTQARILAVARDLLPEVGPAGLTYSLLAERAGVTRQTLYRHWPARAGLLVDLVLTVPEAGYPEPAPEPEPGPDPRAVAGAWLASLRAGLSDPAVRAAVLTLAAQADADSESAEAVRRISADRLAAFNFLLLPSGRQVTAEQYAVLVGPVLARLFFDRTEVTDAFCATVVSAWLTSLDRRDDPGE
jgi:AcrR family transcriptional regulator